MEKYDQYMIMEFHPETILNNKYKKCSQDQSSKKENGSKEVMINLII